MTITNTHHTRLRIDFNLSCYEFPNSNISTIDRHPWKVTLFSSPERETD